MYYRTALVYRPLIFFENVRKKAWMQQDLQLTDVNPLLKGQDLGGPGYELS